MANSIVTNVGAMAAVRTLSTISNDMNKTQSRIESGLKVNKASDDPAVFTIAQGMRADQGGLQAVQDGLAFGKAALGVASAAAKKISDELTKLKTTVTQAQQQGVDPTTMQAQIDASLKNIDQFAKSATFNGVNLLDSATATAISGQNQLSVLQDIKGNTMSVNASGAPISTEMTTGGTGGLGLEGLRVNQGGWNLALDSSSVISFDTGTGAVGGATGAGTPDNVTLTKTYMVNGATHTDTFIFEFNDGTSPLQAQPGQSTNTATQVFDVQVTAGMSLNQAMGVLAQRMQQQGFGATAKSDGSIDVSGGGLSNVTTTIAGSNGGGATAAAQISGNGAGTAIQAVDAAITRMGSKLATLGAATQQVEGMQDFSKQLMDSLKEGLGALVDADLAEESAKLQSLQTRNQLAIQSLSMANQGPQALLSLFR